MIKLLIGGSPCTHWSIAKSRDRETEPSGIGWELFKNFVIAREKFKPDFFLYENVQSASPLIKEAISEHLGVDLVRINSALVSAQNRDRMYGVNAKVEQPEDRGILLRDILESGVVDREKSYALKHQAGNTRDYFQKHHTNIAYEPVRVGTIENDAQTPEHDSKQYRVYSPDGKSTALCGQGGGVGAKTGLYATPVKVGTYPNGDGSISASQPRRIYSVDGKSRALQSSGGGNTDTSAAKTGLYAEPVNDTDGKSRTITAQYSRTSPANVITNGGYPRTAVAEPVCVAQRGRYTATGKRGVKADGGTEQYYEARTDGKTNSLTTVQKDNMAAEPVYDEANYEIIDGATLYVNDDKIRQGDEAGTKQGKYVYTENAVKSNSLGSGQAHNEKVLSRVNSQGAYKTIYEVRDGQITIKGKQYPIKLADGYYIIRKLTVTECCRLQTLPDDYCRAVSATQGYKGLGNGWTAEVIIHILRAALAGVPRTERIRVLSMYDGIGTGMYCLRAMGFENIDYHAYEIDKFAMRVAMSNFPGVVQHGDAFQVRNGLEF